MKNIRIAALFVMTALILSWSNKPVRATFDDLVLTWSNTIADEASLSYSKRFTVDMNAQQISKLSADITYGTATVSPATFTDGMSSTANWTVVANSALAPRSSTNTVVVSSNSALQISGAYDYIDISSNGILNSATAYNTITITSMSALIGSSITLSGTTFREGFEWRVMPTSAETTVNLSTALRTYGNGHEVQTTTTSINVILLRLSTAGSFGNNTYWLATSTPAAYNLLSSTFIGGRDNAVFNLAGTSFTQGTDWTQNRFSTNTANSMAAAVNASTYPITARTDGARVILETAGKGQDFNNLYSLASSTPAAFAVRWTHLSFGWAKSAKITMRGVNYVAGQHWRVGYASTNTAQSIALALSSDTAVTASFSSNVVLIQSVASGTALNDYTLNIATFALASATGALTMGNTGYFINGLDPAVFRVNGWPFICGRDWFQGLTATDSVKSLTDAIMNNARVNTLISSTWSTAAVGYSTSTKVNQNTYNLFTSTQAALKIGNVYAVSADSAQAVGYFMGGQPTSISTITYYITTPSTFSLAMPVLFTKQSGTTPIPLTVGTTYFVTNVTGSGNGSKFQLAVKSSGALANVVIPVAISSQNPAGGGQFTLTPVPWVGMGGYKFQISNNNRNWYDIAATSTNIDQSTLTGSTSYYDFGTVNARYVGILISTPVAGQVQMKVEVNGKK